MEDSEDDDAVVDFTDHVFLDAEAMSTLNAISAGSRPPSNGGKSHLYIIECSANGIPDWEVVQPYSAYRSLHSMMKKIPQFKEVLPPMPGKHYFKGSSNETVVQEREVALVPVLEAFLQARHDAEVGSSIIAFLRGMLLPGDLKIRGEYREPARVSTHRQDSELMRDFMRTFVSGNSIFLSSETAPPLVPMLPSQDVCDLVAGGGDFSAKVTASVDNFSEQLREACLPYCLEVDDATILRLVEGITVSSVLSFVHQVGVVPPVVHQPKYVVVLGPSGIRLSLWGFVGDPVVGEDPAFKHTPLCVRVDSQDLTRVALDMLWGYVVYPKPSADMQDCIEELAWRRGTRDSEVFRTNTRERS